MRAFVIVGPGRADVREVPQPTLASDEVVVDVERVGLCGTDAEFYSGEMSYLHSGDATYPMRIGHEWTGVVSEVGDAVDRRWLGRRVTADTMLGCGRCARCTSGRQHLCADRFEIGIRRGRPGALAERVAVPERALLEIPDSLDPTVGALVEPGGNALRAWRGAALGDGERLLVLGAGTIGLLVGMFAAADGAEVHLVGRSERSLAFASSLGVGRVWSHHELSVARETGRLPTFDAIVDASNAAELPALAVELVEPGRRVVLIGLAGRPSLVDTRSIALKDVTVVGVLSASGGLEGAIARYASGDVDPRPLVAATVGLDEVADVLAGKRPAGWGTAPKIHVDPRR